MSRQQRPVFCSHGPVEQHVWPAFVTLFPRPIFSKLSYLFLKNNIRDKRRKQHLLFEGCLSSGWRGESGGGGHRPEGLAACSCLSPGLGARGVGLDWCGGHGGHVGELSKTTCPVTA